jgi:hypothetical protein
MKIDVVQRNANLVIPLSTRFVLLDLPLQSYAKLETKIIKDHGWRYGAINPRSFLLG